jgi:ATP-dependent protease HslVU (ClpYQ) ATPase subunit
LAGAYKAIKAVELIPEASGAFPMYELLQRLASISSGVLRIDEEPGAGLALDWSKVEKLSAKTYHCR